ncbi:DUF212 domain-containing protein [Cephalotus follicularis]|uniref:DUF212 domain-containing protein n=1 Tax=Cephalotus follicularis TaxID=3775 RepID=A0A1Q3CT83_CEPFO|nr:DUF212 domain-containing protein [Cephalotus follicularis]
MDFITIRPALNSFYFKPQTKYPFKFKTTSISFSYNTPSHPNSSQSKNYKFPLNFISLLPPILQTIKGLAFTQTQKWVSSLNAYSTQSDQPLNEHDANYLQNGSFAVAIFNVTSTAKVKISPFVSTLVANPTFVSGLFAWFFAQSIKIVLNFFMEKKWDFRILFASGGMPSSHSALCTALTTSVALCHGVADSLFPVCLGFSSIVMYDAIGVRRHAGMQAKVLNLIVEDLFQGHPISQRKLKELLGHTPSQVLGGAVLGIMVACFCCQGCVVATCWDFIDDKSQSYVLMITNCI